LRLAVADDQGVPSEPYVLEFIEQVETLSDGSLTIEPVWDAGSETFAGFETGVIQLVTRGKLELGLAASRAWDTEAITNLQALQAPFLITNDALAEAVAAGDIGKRLLNGLSSVGVVGLALWPEDLRHPFSLVPDKPLLSPEDFVGLDARATPSDVTYRLMDTLGAAPMFGDVYQAAESGLRQGASLTGTPTATGNVIFFPKFQVLFANGDAFERLSDAQRTTLRDAAAATQEKAVAEHPREAEAAAAWCADGGSIVLASDEQVAAFERAAQPVFDQIEQDPLNAELVAAIRALKAATEPSPGAEACGQEVAQRIPESSAETDIWAEGVPPNGVWQAEMTVKDFVERGVMRSVAAAEWAGVYTLTLQDGKSLMHWQGEQGQSGKCQASYEVIEDIVRFTYYSVGGNECENEIDDLQWRLDDDGLHFRAVDIKNAPLTEIKAYLEAKPWQKVEQSPEATTGTEVWSEGLPPNGVWHVELTQENIIDQGVLRSKAAEWAGTFTWTFQDGKATTRFEGIEPYDCEATYAVVEDMVRFTYSTGSDCEDEIDDMKWRLEDDGLHLHLVDITNAPFVENKAYLEAKPWRKID